VPVKVNPNISVSIAYENIILIVIRVIYLFIQVTATLNMWFIGSLLFLHKVRM